METRHGRMPSVASDRKTEILSLTLGAGALFTLVALLSYSPQDPSWLNTVRTPAQNLCGKVGSHLAALFLNGFGIAAFLLPAVFGFLSVLVYQREGRSKMLATLMGMGVAVLSLTVFVALQWKYWPFSGSLLLTGGVLGAWAAEGLLQQFNATGSSIVSGTVFLVAIAAATPILVARWIGRGIGYGSRVLYQGTRLLVTYVAYLLGLLAMRGAHAAGDVLQRLIEGAIRRARERSAAKKAAVASSEVVEVETEEVPQLEAGAPASEPELLIGVEAVPNKLKPIVDQLDLPEPHKKSKPTPLASTLSSEAPNVLPDLEATTAPRKPVALAEALEILPPEPSEGAVAPRTGPAPEEQSAAVKAANRLAKAAARIAKRGQWKLPKVEFLNVTPKIESTYNEDRLRANAQTLTQKFADFGIDGQVTAVRPGPVITLYEFKPGPGVKVSRIASLADDLSMALSAQSVRILAPLPGKAVVGIEIPSDHRQKVFFREFLDNTDFFDPQKYQLPVVMGKDIGGQPYLSDLARMPHLLCAGQTGAGKSVFMNGLICSLLYRFTPDELRLVLVDPKFIEFRAYQDIPHLLLPVVDDAKQASTALKWAVREMERRYRILAMLGSRNLAAYNQKVQEMGADVVRDLLLSEENQGEGMEKLSGGDWIEAFEHDETGAPRIGKLPFIVVIIDELADLMMIAKKDVEISIARIAQKARAAGIHLVIATQRPSTDVVTGLIKANLPSRVSFQLSSQIDSRTILDRMGAERLLGQGDMLFVPPGVAQLLRLHGAYLDDGEINKVTAFLKEQGKPAYRDEILIDEAEEEEGEEGDPDFDSRMEEAIELARKMGSVSASALQRHMKIGYNRAARIVDQMESRGIVGPADGARPRELLMR